MTPLPPPLLLLFLPALLLSSSAHAFPLHAIRDTIATLNETSRTVCVNPAPWNQILSFFLINYLARVATFKKTSGYEGWRDYLLVVGSLFVPFIGISGAAATIARGSRFLGHTEIDRALYAEALCVIIRENTWRPQEGEIIRGCAIAPADERGRRRMERRIRRQRRSERKEAQERRRMRRRDSGGKYERPTEQGADYTTEESAAEDGDGSERAIERDFSRDTATLVMGDPIIQVIAREKYKIHGTYHHRHPRAGGQVGSADEMHDKATSPFRLTTASPSFPQGRN